MSERLGFCVCVCFGDQGSERFLCLVHSSPRRLIHHAGRCQVAGITEPWVKPPGVTFVRARANTTHIFFLFLLYLEVPFVYFLSLYI